MEETTDKHTIKEFNKGILTLLKNDTPVICSFNAAPYVVGTNAIGQPVFNNTACGSWCNHFKLWDSLEEKHACITCGCKEVTFQIEKVELKDDSGGGKILSIGK